jgi:hypothetical protein
LQELKTNRKKIKENPRRDLEINFIIKWYFVRRYSLLYAKLGYLALHEFLHHQTTFYSFETKVHIQFISSGRGRKDGIILIKSPKA